MIAYIYGNVAEATPAYAVIDCNGVGYMLNISLTTYTQIQNLQKVKLHVQEAIREDAYNLFGFFSTDEREVFRLLTSVSGIGANTARIILSAYQPQEIRRAIIMDDVNTIKGIKGIGLKTAQRIVVDLKDKMTKLEMQDDNQTSSLFPPMSQSPVRNEALSALEVLGFKKDAAQKDIDAILAKQPDLTVEQLVKLAIKEISIKRR
ncbi:MAG: Holliday junction branch migration protein RuvA [Marinilabiliaceae bacterium]|nr:Holliday junction branch migration protein RuvA [Marinilabiliaceae bacterium]